MIAPNVRPGARRRPQAQPLLILGATGSLGKALRNACRWRAIDHVVTDRTMLDLSDSESIERALATYAPWAVINAAGWVRVDEAQRARDACLEANSAGAVRLLEACVARSVPCVQFSSDLVFDGEARRPYLEGDRTNPLCVYGESKVEMERAVLTASDVALVIRTSAFFSPFDPHNFAAWVFRELSARRPVTCASDAVVSPTYTPGLADAVLDLLLDGERGLWHVANEGALTWHEFAQRIAGALQLDAGLVLPGLRAAVNGPAPRPAYSPLGSSRGRLLPTLEESLATFARHAPAL